MSPRQTLLPEDLYLFRWLDHPRLSPDAQSVIYQVSWADAEARENRGAVFAQGLEPGAPSLQLPGSGRRDRSPEWSPDGSAVAFLGRVGAQDQVFVAKLDGSTAAQLTSIPDGVKKVRWSPDGTTVAFLGSVLSDPDAVVDDPRPPESTDQSRRPPVARVVRRLDYKHDGGGYDNGRFTHLFVVPAGGSDATQLTEGAWSVEDFDWAPDSSRLAATGDAEPAADLRRVAQLWLVGLDRSRSCLVGGLKISTPRFAPDGGHIAFMAPRTLDSGRHERVWVVPTAGGEPRCLTSDLDRAADGGVVTDMRAGHDVNLVWSADGGRIHFQAARGGVVEVCSVDTDGDFRVELASQQRAVCDFDVRDGVIAACITDAANPGDLWVLEGAAERRLTDLNGWLKDRFVAAPESLQFASKDGLQLEGWLLKPQGFDPSRKHPLVMEIHGGPHGLYGWGFFHEFQVLAGMGFCVFYMNPRGSDGYGEVFKRAVVRDWGGADYEDLMTSLDQLLADREFIDAGRMGVGGGSYGGYMTNWIVGHTDRFRAAVAMRSLSNLVSEYFQHDIVPWGALELGPLDWSNPEELWRRSPIRYVESVRTPLLLLHGEMDLRCAISQAEEMFGALRVLGREVELVRFPGESHDLSRGGRPDRRVERLRRIAGWFERHLLSDQPSGVRQ